MLHEELLKNKNGLLVSALAGTGKTTFLINYALNNPNLKILYTALNDSVIKEAREKFPKNVNCYTMHSIAYQNIGYKYKHKLSSYININRVSDYLLFTGFKKYFKTNEILSLLNSFCYSEYDDFERFLPKDYNSKFFSRKKAVALLNILWKKMIDKENDFPITHDVYLKLYQLSNKGFPYLSYDLIMLDETQDSNDCIKSIILTQKDIYNNKTILVGDPYQYIYGFRGSVNIFEDLVFDKSFEKIRLTKTFRFGKKIEEITNILLKNVLKSDFLIEGNENINDSTNDIDYTKKYTVITRTNASLIGYAINSIKNNKKIYFLGKNNINFDRAKDIYFLKNNEKNKIKSKKIKIYKNYKEFKKESIENNIVEDIFLIKVIEKYKDNFLNYINSFSKNTVQHHSQADIILTTVHTAKGLEFDQVVLGNDYYSIFDKNKKIKQNINKEEVNIIYTAVTRAKYKLKLNNELKNIKTYYEQEKI
tara:strand:+ start:98452 stop:99885 length:1434 start_codon:yes stop_codon:yes gene_type:complete